MTVLRVAGEVTGIADPFKGVIRCVGDGFPALVDVGEVSVDGWIYMLGPAEADADGGTVNSMSGVCEGKEISCTLGGKVGSDDGPPFGRAVGSLEGCDVGSPLGCNVGRLVGRLVGADIGRQLGTVVGSKDG